MCTVLWTTALVISTTVRPSTMVNVRAGDVSHSICIFYRFRSLNSEGIRKIKRHTTAAARVCVVGNTPMYTHISEPTDAARYRWVLVIPRIPVHVYRKYLMYMCVYKHIVYMGMCSVHAETKSTRSLVSAQ